MSNGITLGARALGSLSDRGSIQLLSAYPPSWSHAGGAALVDRCLAETLSLSDHQELVVTNRLSIEDGESPTIEALSALPLQIRSSRRSLAQTAIRMMALREPYGVAKFRTFRGPWREAVARLGDLAGPRLVASSFLPLLVCADAGVRPWVYIAHNVEWALSRNSPSPLPGSDWKRLRDVERRLLGTAQQVYALSPADAAALSSLADVDVQPLDWTFSPPGVPKAAGPDATLTIGYLGSGSWPPNQQDIAHLVTQILPRLRSAGVDCELLLAGRGTEMLDGPEGVRALGPVSDLADFYDQVDVVAVPRSDQSTGVSIKVVEALGRQVPVVTSSTVAAAIGSPPSVLIADSDDEMVAALMKHRGVVRTEARSAEIEAEDLPSS